ncbi:cell surface protein [Delftia sp. PE138]|uniref:cell surface protein n=1 Tax=Delftia sp. PE138 TaxID=1812483 RepID=UPI001BB08B35|nr:cell surface protein [Delftia sp. PE138]MBS3720027.1 hypothetical protein [Delftia sp. PE138]
MKKNVLALSIAAMVGGLGFAGAASAAVIPGTGANLTATDATELQVDPSNMGHMLLVPYFNAQAGNTTVFHVVNTDTKNGKAVKVRFRGASNSDDILDFQLFLSPGDVWTGAVSEGASGVAQLVTNDGTCTAPAIAKGAATPFNTQRLNSRLSTGEKANQTREGYLEIFNMADIPATASGTKDLYNAIKHVKGNAPCAVDGSDARKLLNSIAVRDFSVVPAGSTNTVEQEARAAGFDTPTGGLMGDWYIMNVAQTTTFAGAATAVAAKTPAGVNGRGNFVHFPQANSVIATGNIANYTSDPLLAAGFIYDATAGTYSPKPSTATVVARNYDLPDMSTPYTVSAGTSTPVVPAVQADNLTSAIAVTSVTNQYAMDTVVSAKTDWVFSMPTRRYQVAANYEAATNANAYRVFAKQIVSPAVPGATNWFHGANTSVDTAGNICVKADGQQFWDREENTPEPGAEEPVFSPSTPGEAAVVRFCGEVSVLTFKDANTSVLGAAVARQNVDEGPYENGWAVVSTANGTAGLPILGSSFIKLTNPQAAAGTVGTYGITWPHRFTRNVP